MSFSTTLLCSWCTPMFRDSFPAWPDRRVHHQSITTLERAAQASCPICKDLWKYFVKESSSQFSELSGAAAGDHLTHGRFHREGHGSSHGEEPALTIGFSGTCFTYIKFRLEKLEDDDGTRFDSIPVWTDSTSSMGAPRNWLSRCLETHSKCRSVEAFKASCPRKASRMRLLRIDQTDDDRIRLLLDPFSDKVSDVRYTTLSHCWGPDEFFKLTDKTKDQLISGISTSILTQTFQDAISVSKSLGVHFIWIDSLCIFQDSDKDWQEQAPMMEDIYKRALFSIAATASAKGNDGCFRTRKAHLAMAPTIRTSWRGRPNGLYRIYNPGAWDVASEDEPLTKRAWVVQEILLPTRILHFSSNQIFWQCYEHVACQEIPDGIVDHRRASHESKRIQLLTHEYRQQLSYPNPFSSITRKNDIIRLWHEALERYTKCHLTFPTDKLVAISGMAKLFQEPLSDYYCAGLWKRRMPLELLWERNTRVQRGNVPQESSEVYRAPSWSWASVDVPVIPNQLHCETQDTVLNLVEIRSCGATTATDDPFSRVLEGVIRLSGYLLELQLRQSTSSTHWSPYIGGRWRNDPMSVRVVLDHEPQSPQETFCLPMVLWFEGHEWFFTFLILELIGNENDAFQRCGIMDVQADMLVELRYAEDSVSDSEFQDTSSEVELQSVNNDSELQDTDNEAEPQSVNNDSELQDTDSEAELQVWGSNWDRFRRFCDGSILLYEVKEDDSQEFRTIIGAEAIEISIV